MSEEARQSREETSNVKPSLTNLSRKCSNCGQTGHNSRTCLEARDLAISEAELKSHTADSNLTNAPHHHAEQLAERLGRDEDAEASDCSGGAYRGSKKKGIPWTEEEHKLFLKGLQKLGKGDWRGISRQFVQTRSPTQVASHAQKYFIRQSVVGKRKRRSSLFDLVPDGSQDLKDQGPHQVEVRSRGGAEPSAQPSTDNLLPKPTFPPAPQGGGPEAFALACWYQSMIMQQSWMQAMAGQLPPNLYAPGNPLQSQEQQQANVRLAAQQQAAAFMAQQQFSVAVAMGAFPYLPPLPQGVRGGPSSKAIEKDAAANDSRLQSAPHPAQTTDPAMHPREILPLKGSTKQQDSCDQPQGEVFGNGRLVKPKAFRAKSLQSMGSMPSYLPSTQSDGHPQMTSGSKDSQDSLARLYGLSTSADPSSHTGGGSTLALNHSNQFEKSCASEGSRIVKHLVPE